MSETNKRYYFAYGSNMDRAQMQGTGGGKARCPDATVIGIARLSDYRFIINSRGVATIIPEPSAKVFGILWAITKPDEIKLDGCEGVEWGTYTKEKMEIEVINEKSVHALVYVARSNTRCSSVIDYHYIKRILSAAVYWELPDWYIEELKTWLRIGEQHS